MSPARARTSNAQIVAAGRELLEAGGLEQLSMQAVAERVGVRAPSLYKRFPGRAGLIAAIATDTLEDLDLLLRPLSQEPDPAAGIRAVAVAYREYARVNPRAYGLLYLDLPADSRPRIEATAHTAETILILTERLVGREPSLEAARLVTAYAHGFISMELAGAFRLGGSVDEAYRYGVDTLVRALEGGRAKRGAGS